MKAFGLKTKLVALAILPTFIVTIILIAVVSVRMTSAMEGDYETTLRNSAYSIRNIMREIDDGDYHLEDDGLWLGPTNLDYVNEVLDKLYEETDMYATIIWNDTRMITSVKNNGERATGTQIDAGIAAIHHLQDDNHHHQSRA